MEYYYLIAIAAILVAAYTIKKITSCLVRTVVLIVMLAILAFAYYLWQGRL